MSGRMIGYVIGTTSLLLLAAALWLPVDQSQAGGPEPVSKAAELASLPGDCAAFVTMRPADFTRDALAKVLSEESRLWYPLERNLDLKVADVERFTIVLTAGDSIQIVRTRKVIDKKKVLAGLERDRGYYKEKGPSKREVSEKKVGGKTVYYYGPPNRWTQGLCILDRKVVARGNLPALEALLDSKVKQSAELKAMVIAAGKHSMVVGFQGKELRALFSREFRSSYGPYQMADKGGKEKPVSKDRAVKDSGKKKEKEPAVLVPFEVMAYKPLVMMKSALITLDIEDGYSAHARVTFPSKEATDDAEHALKTVLYVFRELAATAPEMDRGLRPLAPALEPVQKALRTARIIRKGNTLETSVKVTVSKAVAKKVSEEMVAERKRIEEERRKSRAKDKAFPKDGFKDKK